MEKCKYCKYLNKENDVYTESLYINGGFYKYHIPVRYCPFCGKKLDYWKTHKYNPNINSGDEDMYDE